MFSRCIVASLALVFSTSATQSTLAAETCSAPVAVPPSVTTPNSTYYSDGLPPERFRKNGTILVQFTDQATIDAICGKAPCKMTTLGCTDRRQMTLPNPCSYPASDQYAQLVCHELGHVNGWPRTHGD
jgi:hypothetical protein